MNLRIRKVDGQKHERVLLDLHEEVFGDSAPQLDPSYGHYWIVYDYDKPIGFAWLVQSTLASDIGYLKRSGVLPKYRGQGLQLRLLKVREQCAKRQGWAACISDTAYHNIHSSNNLIRAGYRLFEPSHRWAFVQGLYWKKELS